LDGRNRKVTLYMPPRNEALERAEGKVLSADDAAQVGRLTGVDEVLSTAAMQGDWLGKPTIVFTQLSPAEGNSQARVELNSANNAIQNDYWDGRVSREAHFAELIR